MLSAFRFSSKARVICAIVSVRAAERSTARPGGSAAAMRACSAAPSGPSGSTRSMRESASPTPSSSCAAAMSITNRCSVARALRASAAWRKPATNTTRRTPPTRTPTVSPSARPQRCAHRSETKAAPGCVRNTLGSGAPAPEKYGRNGPSANGSMPSTCTTASPCPAVRAYPSTTGAAARTPSSTRSRR